ncbi:Bacterial regulatory protein, tetR family [Nocardioides dokdonensis FR1436]|uniref:Bacterial regulatory protein, tetR family n=1 Tax=Nocardioides dokdonensis FR1436 TaxID=1300347 RepID=A0A1A9GK62_9ACTN|nr:TetR family transcriptional regulator [Nocardioides dokdonensis]ANH37871.1 Bacterial regulatory protein, tetR family [Nocardioides dokdonensis FR1436]
MESRATTLNARRRADTRLSIARAAAGLFVNQGLAATTVEQIAAEAGVGLRTFYRYFPSKQDAVVPLLAQGADDWHSRLSRLPADRPLREAVAEAVVELLDPVDERRAAELELARGLVRTVAADRDLQRVWHDVNGESQRLLVPVLAQLVDDPDPLVPRMLAAAVTDAVRIGLELWAALDAPDDRGPATLARDCFWALSAWYEPRVPAAPGG